MISFSNWHISHCFVLLTVVKTIKQRLGITLIPSSSRAFIISVLILSTLGVLKIFWPLMAYHYSALNIRGSFSQSFMLSDLAIPSWSFYSFPQYYFHILTMLSMIKNVKIVTGLYRVWMVRQFKLIKEFEKAH